MYIVQCTLEVYFKFNDISEYLFKHSNSNKFVCMFMHTSAKIFSDKVLLFVIQYSTNRHNINKLKQMLCANFGSTN